MQASSDTLHLVIDIATPVILVGVSWVGLLIRASLAKIELTQAETKADLLSQQISVKEDLQQKHAENRQQLAIHMAEDVIQFAGLTNTGVRMEAKLDKLVDKIINGGR
jgi:hypothetical protein